MLSRRSRCPSAVLDGWSVVCSATLRLGTVGNRRRDRLDRTYPFHLRCSDFSGLVLSLNGYLATDCRSFYTHYVVFLCLVGTRVVDVERVVVDSGDSCIKQSCDNYCTTRRLKNSQAPERFLD